MGCEHISSAYKGFPTIIVSFIEVCIFVASFVATWKHFHSAGKRLSNIAVFHLTHSGFSFVYATFNLVKYFENLRICICDPFMFVYVMYVIFYLWMWVIFLKYWDMATRYRDKNHRQTEVRIAVYASIGAAYIGCVYYFTVYQPECETYNFNSTRLMIQTVQTFCLTIESASIAWSCVRRYCSHYQEYQHNFLNNEEEEDDDDEFEEEENEPTIEEAKNKIPNVNESTSGELNEPLITNESISTPSLSELSSYSQNHNRLLKNNPIQTSFDIIYKLMFWESIQTFAFVSLPISLILGWLMRFNVFNNTAYYQTYPIYFYLYPSAVMLLITWKRHYIKVTGKSPQDLENEWLSDSEHSSHGNSLLGSSSSLYVVPVLPSSSSTTSTTTSSSSTSRQGNTLSTQSSSIRTLSRYKGQQESVKRRQNSSTKYLESMESKDRVASELAAGLVRVEPLSSSFTFTNSLLIQPQNIHGRDNIEDKDINADEKGDDEEDEETLNDSYGLSSNVLHGSSLLPPSSPSTLPPFHSSSSSRSLGHSSSTRSIEASSAFLNSISSVKVIEDLRPPYAFLSISFHFISSIVLPSLEKALLVHKTRIADLLTITDLSTSTTSSAGSDHQMQQGTVQGGKGGVGVGESGAISLRNTRSSTLYSSLEIDRQHLELEKKCDELTQGFIDFVLELRDIVDMMPIQRRHPSMPHMFEDIGYMKQSAKKKVKALALFSTNLQIHKTRLFYQVDDEKKDEKKEDKGSGGTIHSSKIEERIISSITFGAPSAHSLGYKNGGLRETINKLTQYSLPSSSSSSSKKSGRSSLTANPDALLKQLELRYESRVREAIVTSQALSAITSAAIEVLSRLIYKQENQNVLIQYANIGLLVHCISLLSTSGNEESMLDDFAGALERLDITLRFHPPNTCVFDKVPFDPGPSSSGLENSHKSGGGANSVNTAHNQEGSFTGSGSGTQFRAVDTTSSDGMRKTDPLNLMSVIKIKPTKISKFKTTNQHSSNLFDGTVRNERMGVEEDDHAVENEDDDGNHAVASKVNKDVNEVPPPPSSPPPSPPPSRTSSIPVNLLSPSTPLINKTDSSSPSSNKNEPQDNSNNKTKSKTKSRSKGVLLGRVTIDIQINSLSSFQWLCDTVASPHGVLPTIKIIPILFNLGVNEMQSIANRIGTTTMQSDINRRGLSKLQEYYKQGLAEEMKLNDNINKNIMKNDEHNDMRSVTSMKRTASLDKNNLPTHENQISNNIDDDEGTSKNGNKKTITFFNDEGKLPFLLNSIAFLVEAVAKEKGKIVDLLLVSSFAARLLNGARTTSCKSAKDRTSVFHTLEVARLAERWGWLERAQEPEFLEELRGPLGVRLQNCVSNIGRPVYSFNSMQLKALPKELRPPANTAGAGEA